MTTVMSYDFGTGSLKAAVIGDGGTILGSASGTYALSQPRPGWAEQDPADLWDAAGTVGRKALAGAGISADAIDAVIFVAPWKGIIPVDRDGRVLRPAIIWMDGRARAQAQRLNRAAGRFVGTGQEFWPRLMWLRENEPEVWADARWLMGMNTYLKWCATGVVVTEPSDDFIHAPEPDGTPRYGDVVVAAGLEHSLHLFPPSHAADALVGPLTETAAQHLGLTAGTPVAGGFGDLAAITTGAGPLDPGTSHIYFGTSSWFVTIAPDRRSIDAPLQVALDRERSAAIYPLQTGCLAYDWIVGQTYRKEQQELGAAIHDLVATDVAQIPPGSAGVVATHWLNGELPPLSKNATGVFVNLTSSHDRRHMVRAVMESICYSHRWSIERYEAAHGGEVGAVTVVGGGASSSTWMQMLADVLRRTVEVPADPRLAGAVGAYVCAVRALGGEPSAGVRGTPTRYLPDPGAGAAYDKPYSAYRLLHPSLAGVFELLNGPEEQHP